MLPLWLSLTNIYHLLKGEVIFVPVQELHTFSTAIPSQRRLQNRNSMALSILLATALPSASTKVVVRASMRKYTNVIATLYCKKGLEIYLSVAR